LAALPMFQEGANLLARQRLSKPLHVVFDENLGGGAVDRAGALDRHMHPAGNRHVGAQKHLFHQL
jgi:hypothetical protein